MTGGDRRAGFSTAVLGRERGQRCLWLALHAFSARILRSIKLKRVCLFNSVCPDPLVLYLGRGNTSNEGEGFESGESALVEGGGRESFKILGADWKMGRPRGEADRLAASPAGIITITGWWQIAEGDYSPCSCKSYQI